MKKTKKKTLPLVRRNGTLAGMYVFSDVARIIRDNSGLHTVDDEGRLITAAAISTNDPQAKERLAELAKYLDVVVLDSADGDSYYMFQTLDMVEHVKENHPKLKVVAGNVSEGESGRDLAEAGADGIKVGQGPGSICSTRREIGIGMPQVTAVYACARAVEKFDIPVCADGGLRYHGDIPIAFAAGAESVMMGSMLAGTDEAPGEVLTLDNGSRVKRYYGMGSARALREFEASRERYKDGDDDEPLPEGVEGTVPYTGTLHGVLRDCTKALRKALRYVKAPNLQHHRHNTRLKRITHAGLVESHPHDISIAKQ